MQFQHSISFTVSHKGAGIYIKNRETGNEKYRWLFMFCRGKRAWKTVRERESERDRGRGREREREKGDGCCGQRQRDVKIKSV